MKRIAIILYVAVVACSHLREPASNSAELRPVLYVDSALIRAAHLQMPSSVAAIYRVKSHKLIWFDSVFLSPQGDSLLWVIRNAARFGLIPEDYHLDELNLLLGDSSAQGNIRTDLYLTDSYFTLRQHIRQGRVDPKTKERLVFTNVFDSAGMARLIERDIHITNELRKLEPSHGQYRALRDSLELMLSSMSGDSVHLRKIEQLKLNMERWRWMKQLPARYLVVNVPSYFMQVMEHDSVVLESRVIVGKPENSTPIIESVITSFIIYPYWHVPRSIAIKEILPAIQYDSTYLTKRNYDVLDRDGNVVDPRSINWLLLHEDNFPYVLRQRDGTENTLGVIKFVFSNPYNVYLHDTNARRLFSKEYRALSHGCVRVQKARELARYLVKDDSVYITPEDLDQYLSLKQRYTVKVVKPIPVMLQYFTSEIRNGRLQFYEDIYKRDSVLSAALVRKGALTMEEIASLQ